MISLLELRKLLYDLRDKRPDIFIRFRLLGELWFVHFAQIIDITNKGVILKEESSGKIYPIPDLRNVMQFELDHNFQNFQAHFHYNVKLSSEFE